MGYNSSYRVQILDRREDADSGDPMDLVTAGYVAERAARIGSEDCRLVLGNADRTSVWSLKWYGWVAEMRQVSLLWPGWLFVVDRWGEDYDDVERAFFLDGTSYRVKQPKWDPPEFDPEHRRAPP